METQGEQTMEMKMNLTEKEMGIEMWERIKEHIRCNHSKDEPINIELLKHKYLKEHNMLGKWENMCILCQKYDIKCVRCPLQYCSPGYKTLWATVINMIYSDKAGTYISPFTLEERLEACDKIIEAIKNDVPDDYKS